jgi:hypothetical protein
VNYRTGNHNPALVYGEHVDAEFITPRPAAALVAVFVREDGEREDDALHYVRAMNAEMPICTCRVICCCGALVGTTSGCETCMEHNGECIDADLAELLDALISTTSRRANDEEHSSDELTYLDLEQDEIRTRILANFGWLGRYAS